MKVTNVGNFAKIFKFEQTIRQNDNITPKVEHVSESIQELISSFSVIEWHCNIAEFSYANHDDHPHLHKQEELLHISFVNNNFYKNPLYKESPKKIMFIPLRKGLREIREIILTPLYDNSKDLRNVVVYLQLKEQ